MERGDNRKPVAICYKNGNGHLLQGTAENPDGQNAGGSFHRWIGQAGAEALETIWLSNVCTGQRAPAGKAEGEMARKK